MRPALIHAKRRLYSLRYALKIGLSDCFFVHCLKAPISRQTCSPLGTGRSQYSALTRPVCGNHRPQFLQRRAVKLTLMGEGIPKDKEAAQYWFSVAEQNDHAYAEFFMKRMERGEQEPPSVLPASTRLLYHMGDIFRDNAPAPAANGVQIDHKRLQRLREKKMAMGHKWNDHENEQSHGMGGMSGM